jgi:glycerol kinase
VDSWLIWKLTRGELHVTDVSNASRTLLYNIHTLSWDDELLELLGVPASVLPEVKPSSHVYGLTSGDLFARRIPIAGIAGDQQAALFGQVCTEPGMAKNTYGTGCFMLLHTGDKVVRSSSGLISTACAQTKGREYALEGSVFIAGAVVQWLRDGLGIIGSSSEIEDLAMSVPDNGGVFFVPALVGLGAPYWDSNARGTILGISRGTNRGHIARAAVESMAFQTCDLVDAMQRDSGVGLTALQVDGGASINNALMQFQADLLNVPVRRPQILETTALGAAYLAGLAVGYWESQEALRTHWHLDREFTPAGTDTMTEMYERWQKAVERSRNWLDSEASND